LSKYDEEFLCLMVGGAYEIPTVALRFFNVHATRRHIGGSEPAIIDVGFVPDADFAAEVQMDVTAFNFDMPIV
jgi:nucleoside-diphosphate-sugar epimerase